MDSIEKIYNEKFSSNTIKNCYYFSNSAVDTLNYLNQYKK